MYSQYEILETTVKRLRTQLQKEVLLAKLKSASAAANGGSYNDSSNGNNASRDRNVVLAGAKNCPSLFRDNAQVLNCEFDNLDRVLENASSNRGDAARQLEKDITVISRIITSVPDPKGGKDYVPLSTAIPECNNAKKQSDIETCVYNVRTYIVPPSSDKCLFCGCCRLTICCFYWFLIYKVLLFWCKYKTIKLYVQYLNVMIFIFVIIVFLSLKSYNALKT